MQRLISTLILGFLSLNISAQTSHIPYIIPNSVKGVFSFNNQVGYLSYSEKGNDQMDLYTFEFLNEDLLSENKKVFFEIPEGNQFHSIQSNQEKLAIFFYHGEEQVISSVEVGLNGKVNQIFAFQLDASELKRYRSPIEAHLSSTNQYYFSLGYNTFQKKGKDLEYFENGYEYLHLNPDFEQVFQQTYHNQKNTHHSYIERIVPMEYTSAVFVTKVYRSMKKYNANIIFYDITGEKTGEYALGNDDFDAYPAVFKADGDQLYMAGYEYNGGWFTQNRSTGLFTMQLSIDGQELNRNSIPYTAIDENLLTKGSDGMMFSSKNRLFIHDLFIQEGGVQLICEDYNVNSGISSAEYLLNTIDQTNTRGFSLMNFFILDISSNSGLTNTNIIQKPKRDVNITNFRSSKRTEEMAKEMKEYGIFSYRYSDGKTLGYFNVENGKPVAVEVDLNTAEEISRNTLEIVIPEGEGNIIEQQFIENSKLLSQLNNLQKNINKMEEGLEKMNKQFIQTITGLDQTFSRYSDLGIITVGDLGLVNYLIDNQNFSMYLQKSY